MEEANIDFNAENRTHTFQLLASSDKYDSNATTGATFHNNYVSTLNQHKNLRIKEKKESCLNSKSEMMQEIVNTKNEIAKLKQEMKDKEGTRIPKCQQPQLPKPQNQ